MSNMMSIDVYVRVRFYPGKARVSSRVTFHVSVRRPRATHDSVFKCTSPGSQPGMIVLYCTYHLEIDICQSVEI